jgi:hypothetical protein
MKRDARGVESTVIVQTQVDEYGNAAVLKVVKGYFCDEK